MTPRPFSLSFAAFLVLLCLATPLQAAETAAVDAIVDNALIKENSESPVSPITGESLNTADGKRALLFAHLKNTQSNAPIVTADQKDKLATIYKVKGNVRVAKKGSEKWEKAKEKAILEEGSTVLTGKDGTISIAFDEAFLNVTHIAANTRAIIRSIEPTDIYLEDGTIYNFFDGLQQGSKWQVTSPTAVAAVRGTHFLANYSAANGQVISAVFDVPEDGYLSAISLIEVLENGQKGPSVDIPEGKQISLKEGQDPSLSLLAAIDPKWLEQIQTILEDLAEKRGEQSGLLPATSGEGVADAMNSVMEDAQNPDLNLRDLVEDVVGSNTPQETNSLQDLNDPQLPPQEEPEDPKEPPRFEEEF